MNKKSSTSARPTFQYKLAALAVAACFAHVPSLVYAVPTGATVIQGSANFNQNGNTLIINNTPGASINWQQFNINANETVRFNQQSANSAVLNRVIGNDPSRIFGVLQSNGQVFLINQNGILIGQGAMIDVNKFVASTLNLSDADFLAKRFNFTANKLNPLSSVVNQGQITTPLGGSVWLIGNQVSNEGIITTPQGQVLLAAGQTVQVTDSAGPELSVTLSANGNKAVNLGQIYATGGKIDIYGAIIEQSGLLKADSASVDSQGRIHLQASEDTVVNGTISATNSVGTGGTINILGKNVTLSSTANLDASGQTGGGTVRVGGDYQGKNAAYQNAQTTNVAAGSQIKADAWNTGNGGKVYVWSDDTTWYRGAISAQGGKNGGNGGFVETSGHQHLALGGSVTTLAAKGNIGTWLLDPAIMCIDTGTCSGTFNPLSHGGVSTDVVAPSTLDSMLASSNVNITVTDYFAFLPNGGTYNVGATASIPTGRSLTITAPYFYANGKFDTQANGVQLSNMTLNAQGTSSSFSAKSGVAELGSSAWMLLSNPSISGQFTIQASSNINLANGSKIEQTGASSNTSIQLQSPYIINGGSTINAQGDVRVNTNQQPSAPLNVTAKRVQLSPYTPVSQVLLGTTSCSAGQWCLDDVTKFVTFTPYADSDFSWSSLSVSPYNWISAPGSVSLVGSFNTGTNRFGLSTNGTININSALTTSGKSLQIRSEQQINLAAAVKNTNAWADLYLQAPTISHSSGGSLEAYQVELRTNNWNSIGTPINIQADELRVGTFSSTKDMVVGIARNAANCPVNTVCFADTDFPQLFTGTWNWLGLEAANDSSRQSGTGGNLYLAGSFNPNVVKGFGFRGKTVNINSSLNTDKVFWMSGNEGVYINQPIAAKAIFASIELDGYYGSATPPSSGTIQIGANGKLTATASSFTHTDNGTPFTTPGVVIDLSDSSYSDLSFINEAGSNAISAPTWLIAYPNSGTVQLNGLLGALTSKAVMQSKGYSDKSLDAGNLYYYEAPTPTPNPTPNPTPSKETVDPCQLNPAQCATPTPSNNSATGTNSNTSSTSTVTVTNTSTTTTTSQSSSSSSSSVNTTTMDKATIATILEQRQAEKTAVFSAGVQQLDANPNLADLPVCSSMSGDLCVPVGGKKKGNAANVSKRAPVQAALPEIERKVAVLFAINNYADPRIPRLEAAVFDAEAIAQTLSDDFGYEVRVVRNPSKAEMVRTLKDVGDQLDANDSLMVFYAGHGEMNKKHNLGYWIPSDGFAAEGKSWVSNRDISRLLNNIDAKQVMLVSDSCYSGSFTGEYQKVSEQVLKQPKQILAKRAVTVMSSGGDAPVSDEGRDGHSIFAWNFMQSLKQLGSYEAGSTLFAGLRDAVKIESEKLSSEEPFSQIPQYGAITSARHQQGTDYLFERRKYSDKK